MQTDKNNTNIPKPKKEKKPKKNKKKKDKTSDNADVYRSWSERITSIFIGIVDAIRNAFRKKQEEQADESSTPLNTTETNLADVIV